MLTHTISDASDTSQRHSKSQREAFGAWRERERERDESYSHILQLQLLTLSLSDALTQGVKERLLEVWRERERERER
jgi:hypothetical protein